MQTSREGLYRTLLHQLLNAHPDLIERTFPRQWDTMSLLGREPDAISLPDLKTGLWKLINMLIRTKKVKVCLFIDGLDEFDGDHQDLVHFFTDLLKVGGDGNYIKMCVASRPWVVFEEAFFDRPNLRMEDLTFNDIKDYVAARFHGERSSALLLSKEPHLANRLITEVVQKASGVFLWATLVVTSLLEGIKQGDRVSDLQERLERLPPDLEDLYTRILNDLDPRYLEQTVQYFFFVEAHNDIHDNPPTVLLLSLADAGTDEDMMGELDLSSWTGEHVQFTMDTMIRRLNSRSKGLIEGYVADRANAIEGGQVQYLHRSVKDYISKPDVRSRLTQDLTNSFDPHLQICLAYSKLFKARQGSFFNGIASNDHRIALCLLYSIRSSELVSEDRVPDMVRVLDRLECQFDDAKKSNPRIIYHFGTEWGNIISERETRFPPALETSDMSFLSILIKNGGLRYLRARVARIRVPDVGTDGRISSARQRWGPWLRNNKKHQSESCSPLTYMLADAVPSWPIPDPIPTVRLLLESGADVNQICHLQRYRLKKGEGMLPVEPLNTSVWVRTVAILLHRMGAPLDLTLWIEITKLMLRHGAEVSSAIIDSALLLLQETLTGVQVSDQLTSKKGTIRKQFLRKLEKYQKYGGELELDRKSFVGMKSFLLVADQSPLD